MGHVLGKISDAKGIAEFWSVKRKRKRSFNSTSGTSNDESDGAGSAKRKKLLTTTQYIYNALFKEQLNTDVSVMALGKVWNLHKVYLSQSPYFYSMFNGSWKEATESFIPIKILDENITIDALQAVFGSLYSDEISVEADTVISILATATLFLLEGIIDKCAEVMIENINEDTVLTFYEAAVKYGCCNVKKEAFRWLEINLLSLHSSKCINLIRNISIELMTDLIKSPYLYVIQTEYSLYNLLRTWMYARIHPNYLAANKNHKNSPESLNTRRDFKNQPSAKDQKSNELSLLLSAKNGKGHADPVIEYFLRRKDKKTPYLYTTEGREYLKPFLALRTQYLINHNTDLQIVYNDNIIPKEWIHKHVFYHWDNILRTDHVAEDDWSENIDLETFNKHSMRCGRILLEPGYQKWRWTGFNFGVDLIFIADSRVLNVRRHHRLEHEKLLSFKNTKQVMIRVSITSLINEKHQTSFTQASELFSLSLAKNEESTLMSMDPKLVHPLLVSVNLLLMQPAPDFKEQLLNNEESSLNISSVPISEIGASSETNCDSEEKGENECPSRKSKDSLSLTDSRESRKSNCHQCLASSNGVTLRPVANGPTSSFENTDDNLHFDII